MSIKPRIIFGYLFLLSGILITKSNLLKIFSTYALIQINNIIPIWVLQVSFIGCGLFLIVFKTDFAQITRFYKSIVAVLFSVLLFFYIANFIASAVLLLDQYKHYREFFLAKHEKEFLKLYPKFTSQEVFKLLSETWSRPFEFEPYTLFKEKSFDGKFVKVSKDGYRLVKDQGPWPPKNENLNIFIFGGSIAFNYSLPDDETIASFIQENLRKDFGDRICIYNFGRGYYFSSQERILFEKLLLAGFVPDIALFLDGINEFYFKNDEPLLSDKLSHALNKTNFLLKSDIVRLVKLLVHNKKNYNGVCVTSEKEKEQTGNSIVNRYLINKKIIESIAVSFNVTPLFIWQPAPTYNYDLQYHSFAKGGFGRHNFSSYGYKIMDQIFKSKRISFGNNFLYLADMQNNLKYPLYVDKTHYTAHMSEKVAKEIYSFIKGKTKI